MSEKPKIKIKTKAELESQRDRHSIGLMESLIQLHPERAKVIIDQLIADRVKQRALKDLGVKTVDGESDMA